MRYDAKRVQKIVSYINNPTKEIRTMENNLPKRKPTRLKEYDYSLTGAYFVTICTAGKKQILSKIVGEGLCALPQNILTPIGKDVEKSIEYINENYIGVNIEKYVIMPNHIHLIVVLHKKLELSTATRLLIRVSFARI